MRDTIQDRVLCLCWWSSLSFNMLFIFQNKSRQHNIRSPGFSAVICWVQSDQYIVGRFDDDFQVKPLCDAGKSVPCIDGGLPEMESGNVSEPPKMKDELNSDAEFQDDECKASSNCCN